VHSTTISGLVALSVLRGVVRHLHAEALPQSDDVAEIASDFAESMSTPPTILNPGRAGHLL